MVSFNTCRYFSVSDVSDTACVVMFRRLLLFSTSICTSIVLLIAVISIFAWNSRRYVQNNLSSDKLALGVDVSSAAVNDGIKGYMISMTHCLSCTTIWTYSSYQIPSETKRLVTLASLSDELHWQLSGWVIAALNSYSSYTVIRAEHWIPLNSHGCRQRCKRKIVRESEGTLMSYFNYLNWSTILVPQFLSYLCALHSPLPIPIPLLTCLSSSLLSLFLLLFDHHSLTISLFPS